MQADGRRWLWRVVLFASLLGVGAWPWDTVRLGFSRALSLVGNACLGSFHVVQRAQLRLEPLAEIETRRPDQNVQEDTVVVLSVPGNAGAARLGISLRRDAYLPLLIFVAAIAALPLNRRGKLLCLCAGTAIVTVVALGSVWALVVYLSSQQTALVPAWEAKLASLAFECWLAPPGNRVIAPLLLAAGLALAAHRRWAPLQLRSLPWETVER